MPSRRFDNALPFFALPFRDCHSADFFFFLDSFALSRLLSVSPALVTTSKCQTLSPLPRLNRTVPRHSHFGLSFSPFDPSFCSLYQILFRSKRCTTRSTISNGKILFLFSPPFLGMVPLRICSQPSLRTILYIFFNIFCFFFWIFLFRNFLIQSARVVSTSRSSPPPPVPDLCAVLKRIPVSIIFVP